MQARQVRFQLSRQSQSSRVGGVSDPSFATLILYQDLPASCSQSRVYR
jgi:hypothetical protein